MHFYAFFSNGALAMHKDNSAQAAPSLNQGDHDSTPNCKVFYWPVCVRCMHISLDLVFCRAVSPKYKKTWAYYVKMFQLSKLWNQTALSIGIAYVSSIIYVTDGEYSLNTIFKAFLHWYNNIYWQFIYIRVPWKSNGNMDECKYGWIIQSIL
jgi:hypothetical protein